VSFASTLFPVQSFRLYSKPAPTAPLREVADYSVEERDRLRDAFRSTADGYRRFHRRAAAWIIGGIAGVVWLAVLLGILLPKSSLPSSVVICFVILGSIAALALAKREPRLVCPGCTHGMEDGLGRYCPECGAPQLQPGGWFRSPCCAACKRSLHRNKGRRYKIRACTHCGLTLDEAGL